MRIARGATCIAVLLLICSASALAEPPDGYYQSAEGLSGHALRRALHAIAADSHVVHSYNDARDFVQTLDEDPDASDQVVLLYSRLSVPKSTWGDYNREHVWPQSLGALRRPAKSDMHHIFAADMRVNSSRSNKFFDNTDPTDSRSHERAPAASYDDDSWEPPDEVKGDIARALFYMDVRYEGDDGEPDLVLQDSEIEAGCDCMGNLTTLLTWHREDPVDDWERRRNDRIYEEIQRNRNPFVDHPEWVEAVWGGVTDVPRFLTIASFNIQFLGYSRSRDNDALATIVEGYDIVVVQEIVAPPDTGQFPDGTPYRPDPEVAAFFDAMHERGFAYVLSEEDTGTLDNTHVNSSGTEWWAAFYDSTRVRPAPDLPGGFLAADRSANPDFDRVPYAFPFRVHGNALDFVLVSVHLHPDPGPTQRARRAHEIAAIYSWIDEQPPTERDIIVLGDMNLQDRTELQAVLQELQDGVISLNDACEPTNTNVNGPRPYDHVFVNSQATTELDATFGFRIVNLIDEMVPFWNEDDAYPGDPYDHNRFRARYSDHHPVAFRLTVPAEDDD